MMHNGWKMIGTLPPDEGHVTGLDVYVSAEGEVGVEADRAEPYLREPTELELEHINRMNG